MKLQISIKNVIQEKLKQNDRDEGVATLANKNTLKTVLILKNNYQVDFRYEHSLSKVLGFNQYGYSSNY